MKLTSKIFFNKCFDKSKFQNFIYWFLKKNLKGQFGLLTFLEKLKFIGFYSATEAGFSISVEDLRIPQLKSLKFRPAETKIFDISVSFENGFLTTVETHQQVLNIWTQLSENFKSSILEYYKNVDFFNPVYLMAFSGARGNISQIRQLVAMRGLMADPLGQIIDFPIRNNLQEGLTLPEYLISCSGARKGIIDTALRTAASGYLTRRLVDVAHHVVVNKIDCQKTTLLNQPSGVFIETLYDKNKKILSLEERLLGRILAENVMDSDFSSLIGSKNEEISKTLGRKISLIRNKVLVRSPLTCQSPKFICQLCYGWSFVEGQLVSLGEAIGVLAAQSIGEPGTQLTMRTFHTGGVFTGQVIDQTYAFNSGIVEYESYCLGILVKNVDGKIGYLTKNSGFFNLKKKNLLVKKNSKLRKVFQNFHNLFSSSSSYKFTETVDELKFFFQKLSLLYIRHKEFVSQTQLLFEVSAVTVDTSLENEKEIYSSVSGEVYFDDLIYSEVIQDDPSFKKNLLKFSKIWILAGFTFKPFNLIKKYKFKNTFVKKFDLVNGQVPFYQSLIQPFFYSTTNKLEIINKNNFFQIKIYSLYNNNFFIFCIFFKKVRYFQIPCNYNKKKYFFTQITNSYELKNYSKPKKIGKFKILYSDFQTNFTFIQYHISNTLLNFKPLEMQIYENTNFAINCKLIFKKFSSEFINFCFVKSFYLQENTSILNITRQGYLKFTGIKQKKKENFFFKNQLQYKIKKKSVINNEFKNFSVQSLSSVNFLQTTRQPLEKTNFLKKPILSIFFSTFVNQLKFFQHLPQFWKLKNKIKYPLIIHWKNLSNHKYIFILDLLYLKKKKIRKNSIKKKILFFNKKLGFFSYVRIFHFIESIPNYKKTLKQNRLLIQTNSINKNLKKKNAFFYFLLSLKISFYKNLVKKIKQEIFLTYSLLDTVIVKKNSFVFFDFFIQGFKDTFSSKKIHKNLNTNKQYLKWLVFNRQLFKKPLNDLIFINSETINTWEFFGDNVHFFKQTQIPTYSKIHFCKKNQISSSSVWSGVPVFSEKKSRRKKLKRKLLISLILEKILPNSIVNFSQKIQSGFLKKKVFPFNYEIKITKIKKKNLDSYINFCLYILKNFFLIKNFNVRFSQILPKNPINNRIFFKSINQLYYNYKLKLSKSRGILQKKNIDKIQDFYEFYMECISKRSLIFNNKFNQIENENLNIPNIYYSRLYTSSLINKKNKTAKKITRIVKREKFKKIFLEFRDQGFVLNFGKKNFSNFYKLKKFKELRKKTVLPKFLINKKLYFILNELKKLKKTRNFISKNTFKYNLLTSKCLVSKAYLFSFSGIKVYWNNIEPIYKHGFLNYKNTILTKTPSIKIYFAKIQDLKHFFNKNITNTTFQIIKKKNYFHSFETQILVRFFLANQNSEIIDYRPLFISDEDLHCQKVNLLQKPLTFNLLLSQVNKAKPFTHKQLLPLSSKNLIPYNERLQLGQIIETGKIVKDHINVTPGQIVAKTTQNFLIRKALKKCISAQTLVFVHSRQIVSESQRICNVFFTQEKTGDIIQGIPKIEEVFEARKKHKRKFKNISIFKKNILLFESQVFDYLEFVQRKVVDNIQKIYCGQGIHIADKHIEIIVRQMTSNVLILDSGETGLLPGEIVSFYWVRKLQTIIKTNYILYEPLLMGISRTCLETSNFISAASFQETTRVLSLAALQNQVDFLGGLKQNVILGNLSPMGTGWFKFSEPLST